MRLRWVEVALFATLSFLVINQYPAFGTSAGDRIPVTTDWAVTYLLIAIVAGVVGFGVYLVQARGHLDPGSDLGLGLMVLAGGAFAASWTLEIIVDGGEAMYEAIVAILAALVVLGLVISASARRLRSDSAATISESADSDVVGGEAVVVEEAAGQDASM